MEEVDPFDFDLLDEDLGEGLAVVTWPLCIIFPDLPILAAGPKGSKGLQDGSQ